VSVCLSVCNV